MDRSKKAEKFLTYVAKYLDKNDIPSIEACEMLVELAIDLLISNGQKPSAVKKRMLYMIEAWEKGLKRLRQN